MSLTSLHWNILDQYVAGGHRGDVDFYRLLKMMVLIMDMLLFFTNILRPICSPLFLFSWRGFFNCVLILATPECEVTSKHRREKASGYKLT